MNSLRNLLVMALLCLATLPSMAVEPVPMGSALRKELFDSIRPKAEELAEKPVKFAGTMRRDGIWVYFIGQLVDSKGVEVPIGAAESAEALALWKKVGDEWQVLEFRAGFTDALFLEFPEKYGAPKALFGE
jgi:hypothetical protein